MAARCLAAARRFLPHHLQPARVARPDEAVQRRPARATANGGRTTVRAGPATHPDLHPAGAAHPVMVTEQGQARATPPPATNTPPTAPRRSGRTAGLPARGRNPPSTPLPAAGS